MRTVRATSTLLVALLAVAVSGCSSGGAATASLTPSNPSTSAAAAQYADAGVTIYLENWPVPAQDPSIEIATPTGRHVYVDIGEVANVQRPWTKDDILLASHRDQDHLARSADDPLTLIDEAFPGQMLIAQSGHIQLPDVEIWSIPSIHSVGETVQDPGATDYIFVIDVGGVRIVHTGDSAQGSLTAGQLAQIGRPDILFTQFFNAFSAMTENSTNSVDLVELLRPHIVTPLHFGEQTFALKWFTSRYPTYYTLQQQITLKPGTLPDKTTVLLTGKAAHMFAVDLGIPKLSGELRLGMAPDVL